MPSQVYAKRSNRRSEVSSLTKRIGNLIMAIWKRKKKTKESEGEIVETPKIDVSSATATEIPPTKEQPKEEVLTSEKSSGFEETVVIQEDTSRGVILYLPVLPRFLQTRMIFQ